MVGQQQDELWQKLFTKVHLVLCFLHSFSKIRDKCKLLVNYSDISSAVWEAYRCVKVQNFQEKNLSSVS